MSSAPATETPNNNNNTTPTPDEAKAVQKRYEGLLTVRTKAVRGKGAWYWAHLEPILVHNSDNGLPKAVKLRCSLCDAVFSASNPSRTASEHLKRGTCPNFSSSSAVNANNVPVIVPSNPNNNVSPVLTQNHRKRANSGGRNNTQVSIEQARVVDAPGFGVDLSACPVSAVASTSVVVNTSGLYGQQQNQHQQQQQLVLSGGKEDLGALAMFEDSVKRLKSPKALVEPTLALSKQQVQLSLDFLADWVYECCGSVSFSSLDHPKFKSFLATVGLPCVSRKDFVGARLDGRYEEAKMESESKIREAMFFQIASDGWKSREGEERFVHLGVNLPNGTCVFRKAVFSSGYVPVKYAEDVLWDTVTDICGSNVMQCAGIVSDKFKGSALRNLENLHHWMVNLCCQYQGVISLVKDFGKELPLFKRVTENCLKLANFVNNKSQVRHSFHKYQLQEYGHAGLLRIPLRGYNRWDFGPVFTLVEDILSSARALQLVLLDESYKMATMEEPVAREVEEMMRNPHFWNELEAVHSLVKLLKMTSQEIETGKPRVGQCLPLWEDLRVKVSEWCAKFSIVEGNAENVFDRRFKKNYHPAWAAAFILDPLYLIRDTSGKYLPPFKCLTPEQEKDVDKLITRLVSREEAHIALMELMKWRTEGLDPVYAQAVQLKQRDPNTGKMKIANPLGSRLVWETYLTEFKLLGKVAVRLIFLQATSSSFKCNWSLSRWISANSHSRAAMERAQKMIFISANSKMEKKEVSGEEDKDADLFTLENEAFETARSPW